LKDIGTIYDLICELSRYFNNNKISDHQQSWGYEDGPWKGPGPPLLVVADLIHKPPASIKFAR